MRAPDEATLNEISKVLDVHPRAVKLIGWALHWIVKDVRGHCLRPPRDEVITYLDWMIGAMQPLASGEGAGLEAARIFLRACGTPVPQDQVRRRVADVRRRLWRERQCLAEPLLQRQRGTPRGSRSPGLDRFLELFLWNCGPHARRKLSAYKDRDDGSARGTIVEVLRLVAPCFDRSFLPASDVTLVKAINRVKRECAWSEHAWSERDYARDAFHDAASDAAEEAGWPHDGDVGDDYRDDV